MNEQRIAVFLDGSNFFYCQKDMLKWWVDPRKLLDWIELNRGRVVDATYYASVDRSNDNQNSYIKALCHMGYRVEEKAVKTIIQNDGTEKHKANLDVEIVADMFATIEHYDEAVLVSGDADFVRPLQMLRAKGKRCFILSTKGFIAQELRAMAGLNYQDLQGIRCDIEKNSD